MKPIRVLMLPLLENYAAEESGIKRVVEAYHRHMPRFGFEFVGKDEKHDLKVSHAGASGDCDVLICHGLYWTGDFPCQAGEWAMNGSIIAAARQAKKITVPSEWVAETFRREMRISPAVVGHGIEWDEWQERGEPGVYVLWNKNRWGDVCDPAPVRELARKFGGLQFHTTFAPPECTANVHEIGLMPHPEMRKEVQGAAVYLATTKETFGIGVLEAMASGIPVLGFAWGGNLETVQHGLNGYLARPGDMDDLAEGLDYCLRHRETLGANGREMAREWTWLKACEKMARVWKEALTLEPPTAAIIIPSYNYAAKVGRAIESALAQDYPHLEAVVVVDDGSPDDGATERAVKPYMEQDSRVRYIRQDNGGVATARNHGIDSVQSTYITCLDADDALKPEFLRACIAELEKDRSLGIAYTGLWYVKPDGSEGLSQWPEQCDYDKQVQKKNQIPTACTFRREMWKRLGGYRQRNSPSGAGEEDAEFWLRAGAYGFRAKKVTDAGLFVYSWQSGRVSGSKDHQPVDWTMWHPWTRDGLHPFASCAKPRRHSHPVREYDRPAVSVVIPVGPGHKSQVSNALDSLEAQSFRKWEAIVVDDTGDPDEKWSFDGVSNALAAYPYVKLIATPGKKGAGYARNRGAEIARAPFLLFIDADDWLYPEYLAKVFQQWEQTEGIIYTDYVGKATIPKMSDLDKLDPDLRKAVYHWENGIAVIGYKGAPFDCPRAVRQPESYTDPDKNYLWCLITALVPRAWHDEIGGFDESMVSWEDWDYWIRMARAGKCFTKVPEELVVYRFYSGTRRDSGLQHYKNLLQYLKRKYEGAKSMPCKSCGQATKQHPVYPETAFNPQASSSPLAGMNDTELVECIYMSPNIGDHDVRGASTGIRYGYRAGGQRFLVHRADIAAQPHLFRQVEGIRAPEPERAPLPEPVPVQASTSSAAPAPAPKRRKRG